MERRLREILDDGKFRVVSAARSRQMRAIRGTGNRSTELRLRFALVRAGVNGWKLHAKDLPGKPDFYFPEQKLAVFVDGCFWHGCPKCGHIPNNNRRFWATKLALNKERDQANKRRLRTLGIATIRIWEHEIKRASLGVRLVQKALSRRIQDRTTAVLPA
jgi:DNA mismatch endonuclease (patch repair protein)